MTVIWSACTAACSILRTGPSPRRTKSCPSKPSKSGKAKNEPTSENIPAVSAGISSRLSRPNRRLLDPCRLVRQVKELAGLHGRGATDLLDPCRLVRQVKEFARLHGQGATALLDPCRLVRPVKE